MTGPPGPRIEHHQRPLHHRACTRIVDKEMHMPRANTQKDNHSASLLPPAPQPVEEVDR